MASGEAEQRAIPPVVYVPCERPAAPDDDTLFVEFHRTTDERTVLLVYSALDRLVDACGERQPWVVVPTERLREIHEAQPFDTVLLDEPLPPEIRRGEEG